MTSRGNEKREIFRDDRDRRQLLTGLSRVIEACRWRLHAYVLMGNHYHLMLETPEPTLSRGMHQLNSYYTQKFNWRHDRVGHLLQGRFKSILVEKDAHLLELVRYVVLNPVRAGLVRSAGEWKWSNYKATAGLAPAPPWLEVEWTLSQFGRGSVGRTRYRAFVSDREASKDAPWGKLTGQIFLGGRGFRERTQRILDEAPRSSEIPRKQYSALRPPLALILEAANREFGTGVEQLRQRRRIDARLAVALLARTDALLRLANLSECLGVRASAASHLVHAAERLMEKDPDFQERIRRIRAAMWKIQT